MAAHKTLPVTRQTISQAEKVFSNSVAFAEKHSGVLSLEVRKTIALGRVTWWACQQDEPRNLARIADIVRQAGDLVSAHYCRMPHE